MATTNTISRVVFENGYEYEGRYDLVHYSKEHPRLDKHVRDFVGYLAGELPSWATKPEDVEHIRRHQESLGAEAKARAQQFLKDYQLEAA